MKFTGKYRSSYLAADDLAAWLIGVLCFSPLRRSGGFANHAPQHQRPPRQALLGTAVVPHDETGLSSLLISVPTICI